MSLFQKFPWFDTHPDATAEKAKAAYRASNGVLEWERGFGRC